MSAAKQRRQRLIADWLRDGHFVSQEEIVARLAGAGIDAAQATVSRDLDELGAVKKRQGGYALAALPEGERALQRLARALAEWSLSVESAGALVVIRTHPGSANLVAGALDAARVEGVVGTIAGDDTVFAAIGDGALAGQIAQDLQRLRTAG
jgi:transcriptional regulator of arginine metabolism